MDEWITLTETNWAFWIAGLFALFEFAKWLVTSFEWIIAKCGLETKSMRHKKESYKKLLKAEKDIQEIRETSEKNVKMFIEHEKKVVDHFHDIRDEVVKQLDELNVKFDEQKKQLEEKLEIIDEDGKKRDCSIMRDRLIQGVRYFSQNKDENGVVHISMTDYENMNEMFQEYFRANGNGVIKHIYETEFQSFKIDSTPFDMRK